MRLSKKIEFRNNMNFNSSTKEKIQSKLNLFSKNKLTKNDISANKLREKIDIIPQLNNNNTTENNSINNSINNIEIASLNHSNENSQKYIVYNSYKYNISNNNFITNTNIINNLLSLITNKNKIRKRKENNSFNYSFNINSRIKKKGRNQSLYKNRITNSKLTISKKNFITNNISSFKNLMNSSINKSIKNHKKFASNLNGFENSLRNKLFNTGKNRIKENELNKKIQKAVLRINKVLPTKIKLNNKQKIKKEKLNPKKNINSKNYLSINTNNTFSITHNKKLNKNKNNSINNHSKNSINNNYSIYKINKFNDNKKQKETNLIIIFKDGKTKRNILIKKPNKKNKNLNENSKKLLSNITTPKKENDINIDSKLSKSFLKSNNTTMINDEGILELDEVKDAIIYYNLNKELNKDYLFEKFDYDFFIKKMKKKYFKFFIK